MASGTAQQPAEPNDDNDSEVDFENLPIGLQMWRIAVATATSPAQLMLCIVQLNKCIAWEKSIMKVVSFCLVLIFWSLFFITVKSFDFMGTKFSKDMFVDTWIHGF